MWYSGNNYGYYAGPAITTSYGDDDVPLHNDGSPREPMFTHLGRLHAAFQGVAHLLLCQEAPRKTIIKTPLSSRLSRLSVQGGRAGVGAGGRQPVNELYAYEYVNWTLHMMREHDEGYPRSSLVLCTDWPLIINEFTMKLSQLTPATHTHTLYLSLLPFSGTPLARGQRGWAAAESTS